MSSVDASPVSRKVEAETVATESTQEASQTSETSPMSSGVEPMGEKKLGHVKFFNFQRGYGFITGKDDGVEYFVHFSFIEAEGFRSLRDGEEVEFEAAITEGKPRAFKVTGPEGLSLQGRKKERKSKDSKESSQEMETSHAGLIRVEAQKLKQKEKEEEKKPVAIKLREVLNTPSKGAYIVPASSVKKGKKKEKETKEGAAAAKNKANVVEADQLARFAEQQWQQGDWEAYYQNIASEYTQWMTHAVMEHWRQQQQAQHDLWQHDVFGARAAQAAHMYEAYAQQYAAIDPLAAQRQYMQAMQAMHAYQQHWAQQ